MILGLVSNCWREQLQQNTPLDSLIDEAMQRGFGAIELRQTCLGAFETGQQCIPDAEALARLPGQFGDMQLSVAMALPFLSPTINPADSMFQSGLDAALSVSGRFTPHLRLVDLTTRIDQLQEFEIDAAMSAMVTLADSAAHAGVMLSVENAVQPWNRFRETMDQLWSKQSDGNHIRLCYDAANLFLQTDPVDPAEVTRSLTACQLSMVHFKQRGNGRFLDSVCDGDIDWCEQLKALAEIEYDGPALFEIESSSEMWQSVAASRQYLQEQGGCFL